MNGIKFASWQDRFWAWAIDAVLMGILWCQIMPTLNVEMASIEGLGCLVSILFLYWTIMDSYGGQSYGKRIMNIFVVDTLGEPIGCKKSALESFGKAFLLPIDCLLGWLKLPGSGQRYFNRASNTIVAYGDRLLDF